MAKTVGRFTYENGIVTGPKEYMKTRYRTVLAEINAGKNAVFNHGGSPDVITQALVAVQTDYAAWKGMRSLGLNDRTRRIFHGDVKRSAVNGGGFKRRRSF